MICRWFAVVLGIVIALAPVALAQEKKADVKADAKEEPNADKLLGSWEMQDTDLSKLDGKATFEFLKDGKAKMSVEIGKQKPIVIEGTYKLAGDQLTLTAKKGEKDESAVVAIKSVSATELVLLDTAKREVRFKKPEPMATKDPFPKNPFPKSPFPKEPFPQ